MSKPSDANQSLGEPAVIIFGRDDKARPHASTFEAVAAELAERAAGLMGMRVLRIATDEHRAAASGLPAGRIFSSGKAFVPFVKKAAYEALKRFDEAFQPANPDIEQPASQVPHVPADWFDIKPGSVVLAAAEPNEPWYPAVVTEARGDDLFLLRWHGEWSDWDVFARSRDHLGLLASGAAAAL